MPEVRLAPKRESPVNVHVIVCQLVLSPENRARFEAALAPLGHSVTMRQLVVAGGGGAAYEQHAAALAKRHSSVWAGLRAEYGPTNGSVPDIWIIWSWSAGYGLVRALLREGVPLELDGICCSDSIYGSDDDPRLDVGVPLEEHVQVFVPYARAAARGECAMVIAAGDVPTPYADTRTMAEAIADRAGVNLVPQPLTPPPSIVREGRSGHLLVRWYDAAPGRGIAEHLTFARSVGASLLYETVRMAVDAVPLPRPTGVPWASGSDLQLRQRAPLGTPLGDAVAAVQRLVGSTADGWWGPRTDALVRLWQRERGLPERSAWGAVEREALERAPTEPPASGYGAAVLVEALADLRLSVREQPSGSNAGPTVEAMLRAVGVAPPANWCAAGATAWLRRAAAALGIECPVAGSAGAQALGMQARRAPGALWLSATYLVTRLIRGPLDVRPGSLIVWRRGPPGSWMGHVGIVERVGGRTIHTIEANSGPLGDRVARMVRSVDDPQLLGIADLDEARLPGDAPEPRAAVGQDPLV